MSSMKNLLAISLSILLIAVFSLGAYAAGDSFGIGVQVNVGVIDNPPTWFNESNQLDSQYSPGKNFQFDITWLGLNQVWFEANYTMNATESGSLTNYTYPDVTNASSIFSIVLNDLPAQTFVYRWIAVDATGNWNSTDYLYYTVEKNITWINLTLNGIEANKSYTLNQVANFTASLNLPGQTIYLNSSCPSWTNAVNTTSFISNTTILTCSGYYSVTSYWNGNENYTSAEKTYYFDTIPPSYSLTSANTSEYNENKTHTLSITISSATIGSVTLELNGTTRSLSNLGNNYWFSFTNWSAGNYTYRWNITNSLGNQTTTGNISYNITKKAPSLVLTVSPSWSVNSGTSTTVNCSRINGEDIVRLNKSGTTINTGSYFASETTTQLTDGTFSYVCWMAETQNYTSGSASNSLTVSSGTFVSNSGGADDSTTTAGQFTVTPSDTSLTIDAGSSKVVTFTLSNTLDNDINVTSIEVSGINSTWYALDKTSISRLNDGTTEKVRMTLNVPSDAEAGAYQIKFKAVGKNLFSGATMTRETTVDITVNSATVQAAETVEEAVLTSEEAVEQNETEAGPTGFLHISSEYIPYMVLVLGIALVLTIFLKRDAVTQNLMSITGMKIVKDTKKKKVSKLASLKNFGYRLSENFTKSKQPKTIDMEEEKVKDLETEIKKDMKELENILEAEKKVKKNRK